MKKLLWLLIAGIAFSCNNGAATKEEVKDSTATTAEATPVAVNYPYTVEHPDNWDMGSNSNTLAALSSLKAWEDGKVDEAVKYFADSIQIKFDAFEKKLSNDSLKSFFNEARNAYKNVKIKMSDWESVVSKDKKEEWVTIWYRQSWETQKGKKDSTDVINDIQLKNGKIVRLDEYTRKLH
jgi:hypothetical protein